MYHMSLLSKAETQFLNGQKQVSKSYEYKLKSIISRKITKLLDKELPLLSQFIPNLDLTKIGKEKGLSSRRSRVQIPAGASVFLDSEKNINNSYNFNEKLEKADRIDEKCTLNTVGNVDKGRADNNQNILPNSVRLSSSSVIPDREELWDDFRRYLINEGQRKHSVRNKVGYAKRYCQILETKDARVLLNLSHGSKVHTMKALASLSKYLGKYDQWLDIVKKYQLK